MRRLACLALLAVAVCGGIGTAHAQGPSADNPGLSHALGMVPVQNAAYRATYGSGKLYYHNGPVMHTNTVYAIYWTPPGYSMASGYSSLIDRFFTDVAADSGKTSNVYYTATQYYDGGGSVAYSSSFAGSVSVSDALPPSGCSYSGASVCLTDAQLQAEIKSVVSRQGWTPNSSTVFFLFTARGIGSCSDSSHCAFTQYCAYHSWIGSGSNVILYANQPYVGGVSGCDQGYHPNGNDADATINVASHEHNEAITDQQGNAWYDRFGYENGDKCAWSFGALSGPSGAQYNQTINGNHYILQLEYSNADRGCVQTGL